MKILCGRLTGNFLTTDFPTFPFNTNILHFSNLTIGIDYLNPYISHYSAPYMKLFLYFVTHLYHIPDD